MSLHFFLLCCILHFVCSQQDGLHETMSIEAVNLGQLSASVRWNSPSGVTFEFPSFVNTIDADQYSVVLHKRRSPDDLQKDNVRVRIDWGSRESEQDPTVAPVETLVPAVHLRSSATDRSVSYFFTSPSFRFKNDSQLTQFTFFDYYAPSKVAQTAERLWSHGAATGLWPESAGTSVIFCYDALQDKVYNVPFDHAFPGVALTTGILTVIRGEEKSFLAVGVGLSRIQAGVPGPLYIIEMAPEQSGQSLCQRQLVRVVHTVDPVQLKVGHSPFGFTLGTTLILVGGNTALVSVHKLEAAIVKLSHLTTGVSSWTSFNAFGEFLKPNFIPNGAVPAKWRDHSAVLVGGRAELHVLGEFSLRNDVLWFSKSGYVGTTSLVAPRGSPAIVVLPTTGRAIVCGGLYAKAVNLPDCETFFMNMSLPTSHQSLFMPERMAAGRDYGLFLPSPWLPDERLLLIGGVSSRNLTEYMPIVLFKLSSKEDAALLRTTANSVDLLGPAAASSPGGSLTNQQLVIIIGSSLGCCALVLSVLGVSAFIVLKRRRGQGKTRDRRPRGNTSTHSASHLHRHRGGTGTRARSSWSAATTSRSRTPSSAVKLSPIQQKQSPAAYFQPPPPVSYSPAPEPPLNVKYINYERK